MQRLKAAVFLLAVPLLAVALVLTPPHRLSAVSQNLLRNPGFEAGSAGWGVQPSTATFAIVHAPVHQGESAASLTKATARGRAYIYQDVPVTAGEHYAAEVWVVWNDANLTNVKLRIEWLNGRGEQVAPRDEVEAGGRSPAFQLLRLDNLVAPQGAVVAQIQGYTYVREAGPSQPALFDDFSFALPGAPTSTSTPTRTATTTPTVVLPSPTPSPTATPSPVPAGAVVINEVFYDPPAPGGDPDDEWVELYNRTERTINLDGWELADHIGEDVLPAMELPAGGFVVVAATESFRAMYPSYDGLLITLGGPIGNGLANGGDSLWLRDDHGRTIDAMAYGDDTVAMFPSVPAAPEGYSLERVPVGHDTDTASDWFPRAVPSPGQGVKIWLLYLPVAFR